MQTKLIEIHDDGIRFSALAIQLSPATYYEHIVFMERYSFRFDGRSILLVELETQKCTADPYLWASMEIFPRTLPTVHEWLIAHFDEILPGHVIDVGVLMEAELDPSQTDTPPDHHRDGS